MESKVKALILSGLERGIDEKKTQKALALKDQGSVMLGLRELGFSFKEIGFYYDKTRAWAAQLLPEGGQAASQIFDRPDPEELAQAIWVEAARDLTWWGSRGRLIYEKLVVRFRDHEYSWREARAYAKKYSISKLDVIMLVSFGIGPEDQEEWFQGLLKAHTKAGIFQIVNNGQNLKVEVRSFNRAWIGMGLKSPRKARIRFEHQFRKTKKNLFDRSNP